MVSHRYNDDQVTPIRGVPTDHRHDPGLVSSQTILLISETLIISGISFILMGIFLLWTWIQQNR